MGSVHYIFWDRYQKQTYLYGTTLSFGEQGSVRAEVPLMPSGKAIHTWYSKTDFQRDRREPDLPILTEGKRYVIRAFLESEPADSVLVRIRFFNRQERESGMFIPDGFPELFTVPRGAYSYTMELVKKGCESVHFYYIEIAEAEDEG